ncbi:flippase [Mangrovimonas cancribranchiae]|uniref:Flippase n=1 Tax=Mangrovimonas cancribranchiae TaxID=3080055 RepID=A0AAU6PAR5_9FLAO
MHFLSLAFQNITMRIAFSKKDLNTTTWFSLGKLIHLFTGVFIVPKIFNTLGTTDMGILTLAGSILGMFAPLFTLGLSAICVREIVFTPKRSQHIIATAFFMRLLSWGFVAIGFVCYLYFTNNTTLLVIYMVLICGYLFRLTDVFEYYLLAKKRAKLIFIGKTVSLFCIVALQYYGVKQQMDILFFAQVIALDFLLQGVFYIVVLGTKNELYLKRWCFSKSLGKKLLTMAFPLIVSEALVMIYIGIDEVILKHFYNDHANGVFGSVQFLVIGLSWTLGFAIINALYPSLTESFQNHKKYYYIKNKQLFFILVALGLFIAWFYLFFGDSILDSYFTEQYREGKTALQIFCWAPLFVFIGMLYEKHLLTANRLKHNVYRFIVGCFVNLLLCYVLIPIYYINGAAIAVLASHFITNIGYLAFDSNTKKDIKSLLNAK